MKTNKMNYKRIFLVLKLTVVFAVLLYFIVFSAPQQTNAAASQFDRIFGNGGKVFYVTGGGTGGTGGSTGGTAGTTSVGGTTK